MFIKFRIKKLYLYRYLNITTSKLLQRTQDVVGNFWIQRLLRKHPSIPFKDQR